jgi:hypothetical protein
MATAKKTPAKKTAAKKAPAKKTSSNTSGPSTNKRSGTKIAFDAARQLHELTGKEAEGISGLERNEDGWIVHVDVLELRRVPNTTDILASYEVETNQAGELMGYRRVHRYVRGAAGEE